MISRKKFVFNGKSSSDYGIFLTGSSTFNATQKSQEKVSVPGRNGDLIISNDKYENQNYVLKAGIVGMEDLHEKIRAFRSFLLSTEGYCRLEDDYHPDEYRLAQFTGPIDFDVNLLINAEADLTFDCKPQHFLKSGEIPITCTAETVIYNSTLFNALPLITITGYGQLQIGNGIISVAQNNGGAIICDCEMMDSYFSNGGNANKYVTVKRGTLEHLFPQLVPGNNTVKFDPTISKVEIKTGWWML